jgi:peptidyl-prolyl cis-trans isomerase C
MKKLFWCLPLMAVFLAVGTGARAEEGLVAKVNGVGITKAEFDRNWPAYMQQRGLPAGHADKTGKVEEFKKELLDLMVDQELLYQAAVKGGFAPSDQKVEEEFAKGGQGFKSPEEFEAALARNGMDKTSYSSFLKRRISVDSMLQEQIAKNVKVTDAEVDEFHTGNIEKFATPEQVRARHILVKMESGATAEQKAAAKKKIEEVLVKAREGGVDFAELAKVYSEGPSAPQGGDLGLFTRGRMVPAFEEAAFSMKAGEISGVVETQFGYHIIKVEERKAAGTAGKEEVADRIRQFLSQQKLSEAVMARLETLRGDAKIETYL